MKNSQEFEVIIIGGSYTGLSAAMSLGRALREVLVIDSGIPRNRQTPHSHNLMPNISGFSACWGILVLHCPYCHGYEIRNEKKGIIANGETAAHYVLHAVYSRPDFVQHCGLPEELGCEILQKSPAPLAEADPPSFTWFHTVCSI